MMHHTKIRCAGVNEAYTSMCVKVILEVPAFTFEFYLNAIIYYTSLTMVGEKFLLKTVEDYSSKKEHLIK